MLRPSGRARYSNAAGHFNTWDIAMTRELRAAVRRRTASRDTLTKVTLISAVVLAVVLTAAYWLAEGTWDTARNRLLKPGQLNPAAVKRVAMPAAIALRA